MSTQQDNGKNIEDEKDNVAELTEKLDNLAVDNTNKANESKPARRGGYGYRGRGRGRGGRTGGRFLPRPPYEEQVKQIEESLKSKKVIETGVNGYVKWFSVRGLYGFIARENAADDKDDFFVHQTAIAKSSTIKYYLRTLAEDEPVVFDIVEGRKGPEAANVTGPDGSNVRGSKRARYLLTNRGSLRRGAARGSATRKPREKGSEEKDKTAAPEEKDKTATPEENEDGETRGKRRPRRARGKLQPSAEKAAKPHEKGDGDTAPAVDGEKKGRRPIRGKGLKKSQVVSQQKQEEAPAKA